MFQIVYCITFLRSLTFVTIPVLSLFTVLYNVFQNVHLVLHHVDNFLALEPSSSFSTERYLHVQVRCTFIKTFFRFESFYLFIQGHNVCSHRQVPSGNITYNFLSWNMYDAFVLVQKGMCFSVCQSVSLYDTCTV